MTELFLTSPTSSRLHIISIVWNYQELTAIFYLEINFIFEVIMSFLYNIAFSLEFLVFGFGALLIGWSRYKCAKMRMLKEECRPTVAAATVVGTESARTHSAVCDHKRCGGGFASGVGVLLMILAILNFADTIYNAAKFHHNKHRFYQKVEMMRNNNLSNPNTMDNSTNNSMNNSNQ